jgi:mono/diheme cytochrome c family protein
MPQTNNREHKGVGQMNKFLCGFATPLMLFLLSILAFFESGMGPIRSDAKPPAWETSIMQAVVRGAVRRSAKGMSAPTPATPESIIAGGKLYMAGCAGCHGEPGKPFREDHDHYPPVPQLPHTISQYSEPEIAWIIKHGVRMTGMSAYGGFYREDQLWALAAFVHRINGLSPAEIQGIQPILQ